MIRRVFWVLAAALFGTGLALIFGSLSLLSRWMLIAGALWITAAGAVGAWRGSGPVSRGERAPRMAQAGAVMTLVGLAVLLLGWGRLPPALLAGCLLALAAGALFVPVGLMGHNPAGSATPYGGYRSDEQNGGTATLRLSRPRDAGALLRRIRVTVDGRPVAALRPGQLATVTVPAGLRVIQATLDWTSSEPLTVPLAHDRATSVEVSVPGSAYLQTWSRPSHALDIRVSDS